MGIGRACNSGGARAGWGLKLPDIVPDRAHEAFAAAWRWR